MRPQPKAWRPSADFVSAGPAACFPTAPHLQAEAKADLGRMVPGVYSLNRPCLRQLPFCFRQLPLREAERTLAAMLASAPDAGSQVLQVNRRRKVRAEKL